jgi:hypothetical protein
VSASRLTDLLALSHVPRWGIVPHVFQQSVADHTFRVWVIFDVLCMRLAKKPTAEDYFEVLVHDGPESRTGDIPTPAKSLMTIPDDSRFCGWMYRALKFTSEEIGQAFVIADLIEAHTFIEMYGKGEHSRRVAADIYAKLRNMTPVEDWPVVSRMIDEIVFEEGR